MAPALNFCGALPVVQKLLCLDPSKRITAREALEHEYFRDLVRPT